MSRQLNQDHYRKGLSVLNRTIEPICEFRRHRCLILPIPEAPPPEEESAVFAGDEGHDIGAAANQIYDLVSQRQRGQKAQISSFRSRDPPLLSEAQGQPRTCANANQGEEHPKEVTFDGSRCLGSRPSRERAEERGRNRGQYASPERPRRIHQSAHLLAARAKTGPFSRPPRRDRAERALL